MIKNNPLSVRKLILILQTSVNAGTIKATDTVYLASDEEGNSFSPLVIEGIEKSNDNKVTLYPLFPEFND